MTNTVSGSNNEYSSCGRNHATERAARFDALRLGVSKVHSVTRNIGFEEPRSACRSLCDISITVLKGCRYVIACTVTIGLFSLTAPFLYGIPMIRACMPAFKMTSDIGFYITLQKFNFLNFVLASKAGDTVGQFAAGESDDERRARQQAARLYGQALQLHALDRQSRTLSGMTDLGRQAGDALQEGIRDTEIRHRQSSRYSRKE